MTSLVGCITSFNGLPLYHPCSLVGCRFHLLMMSLLERTPQLWEPDEIERLHCPRLEMLA